MPPFFMRFIMAGLDICFIGALEIDGEGNVVTEGGQVLIGGNDSYVAMCHSCWQNAIASQANEK